MEKKIGVTLIGQIIKFVGSKYKICNPNQYSGIFGSVLIKPDQEGEKYIQTVWVGSSHRVTDQ